MKVSTRLYLFDYKTNYSGLRKDVACIFISNGDVTDKDIVSAIQTAQSHRLRPDIIQLVTDSNQFKTIAKCLSNSDVVSVELERLPHKIVVVLTGFEIGGRLANVEFLNGKVQKTLLKQSTETMVQAGLRSLVINRRAVTLPPSGARFVLNNCSYPFFIRASRLCATVGELEFVSFALVRRLPEPNIARIYVDSSSILAIGCSLARLLKRATALQSEPAVESFRSYDGLEEFDPEPSGSFLVLVSASGSGRLAQKLRSEKGVRQEEIITLLANFLEDSQPGGLNSLVLHSVKDLTPNVAAHILEQLNPIRVFGEDFQAGFKPPSSAIISKACAPSVLPAVAKLCAMPDSSVFSTNQELKWSTRQIPVTTYVDFEKLKGQKPFQDWLDRTVKTQVPGSEVVIVWQDDSPSESLAQEVKSQLQGIGRNVTMTSSANLLSTKKVSEQASLVVVAGVASRGSKLLEISRDIRVVAPKLMRTYIVGFCVPEQSDEFNLLRSNLTMNNEHYRYNFCTFLSASTGPQNRRTAWNAELVLITEMEKKGLTCLELQARKSRLLNSSQGLIDDLFWPAVDGTALSLSEGFVFLPDKVNYSLLTQAEVHFIISTVLQCMRETRSSEKNATLFNDDYQHKTLAPENFYRFNDPILQASILRASLPSELDYSYDDSCGTAIAQLIAKLCKRSEGTGGQAAMEFLISLASERLRISTQVSSLLAEELQDIELRKPANLVRKFLVSRLQ